MCNMCSNSTKTRILPVGIREWAKTDEFGFSDLLRIICGLYSSLSHAEPALQSIYGGAQQALKKSVPVYLESMRYLDEENIGPAVHQTLHDSLKIVSTVISDLRSKLSPQVVAGYMINLLSQFHLFQKLYSTNVWSTPAVWKQYNKMAVSHFFQLNSILLIYSLCFSTRTSLFLTKKIKDDKMLTKFLLESKHILDYLVLWVFTCINL